MIHTDICVIGAGSGGLSVAVGAAQMGAHVVLIENRAMGGDCLNYGCVPSKSLIAAAKVAHQVKTSEIFGVTFSEMSVDMDAVYHHIHGVVQNIAPNDSVARMESLGIKVIHGSAKFISPREIRVENMQVRAKYFVIASGSKATIPAIAGLEDIHYFTNETIFDVRAIMQHLIIIGGGPAGVEMAQAHRRLGCGVTIIQRGRILPRDDDEMVEVVKQRLRDEGVSILEQSMVIGVSKREGKIVVEYERFGKRDLIIGSNILIASGRTPNVGDLRLELANVDYDQFGISVDERLRTSNKRIFAVGDVIGHHLFTHMAAYHAEIVLRNILFKLPSKVKTNAIPWVTYTDPEIAHVGLNEAEAKRKCVDYRILRYDFKQIDRAQTERETEGMIKVLVCSRGKILGVSIVGHNAGELLLPWVQAITRGENIKRFVGFIVPYPTYSEISKRVAGSYFAPKLFSDHMRRFVRFLLRFS